MMTKELSVAPFTAVDTWWNNMQKKTGHCYLTWISNKIYRLFEVLWLKLLPITIALDRTLERNLLKVHCLQFWTENEIPDRRDRAKPHPARCDVYLGTVYSKCLSTTISLDGSWRKLGEIWNNEVGESRRGHPWASTPLMLGSNNTSNILACKVLQVFDARFDCPLCNNVFWSVWPEEIAFVFVL